MKIGVIGAGFIGRSVAQLALAAGHEVMLSNSRGPQTMSSVLSGIWGVHVGSAEDAAQFGDVVLVAIPLAHYRSVPVQGLEGKTVMDANNYYPERDGHIPELDRFETTTSRLLADHLPPVPRGEGVQCDLCAGLDAGRPPPRRTRAPRIAGGRR